MKRLLPVLLIIALGIVVAFVLHSNKEQMEKATDLAEALVERVPVTTYVTRQVKLKETIQLSGKLAADDELMLMSTIQGRVVSVPVNKGDYVKAGQVVAIVDDELYREQYEVAKSAWEKLSRDEERFGIMLESEAITQQQYEGLQLNLDQAEAKYLAAKKQLEDTRVKSPIAGYVNQLFLKPGNILGAGVPVCEIVNTSSLTLSLKIAESELPAVSGGQEVNITVGAMPGDTLQGVVSFMSVKPDYANQYSVDITLNKGDHAAGAGMLATAYFPRYSDPALTYLPEEALLGYGEEQQFVYRVQDSTAQKVIVNPMGRIAGYVGLDGLGLGETVILRGNTIVRDGQRLKLP